MTLQSGTKLGPYEILAPIGAGGMGEVYKAKDTRLDRLVAVKVLPEHLATHPDALARFEREAKAVAALNHPNILGLHDIGHEGSTAYAVMELLEGESLRTRLEQGPLPVRKATELAGQLAQGLAAAHEKGIVHRDLKPDNLWITKDGRMKILDFGLARLAKGEGTALLTQSPTLDPGTAPGTLLGTMGYMSPEQVRGEIADHRSDIFSFGVVLYEMLAGRKAFARDSASDTLAAILRDDPPELDNTSPPVPPSLQRVLMHCLEKKPGERFQSARDIAFALQALSGSTVERGPAVAPSMPASTRRRMLPAAVACVVFGTALMFLAVALAYIRHWPPFAPQSQPTFRKLTFGRGAVDGARFVPGSRDIVYSARWQGDPSAVYLLREGSPGPRGLEVPAAMLLGASAQSVAVLTRPALMNGMLLGTSSVLPLAGGGTREISRRAIAADFAGDGSGLYLVSMVSQNVYQLEGPQGEILLKPSPSILRNPRVRGTRVAYFQAPPAVPAEGEIRVMVGGAEPRSLARCTGFTALAWGPGEEIWFSSFDGSESRIEAVSLKGRTRLLARYPGRLELVDVDAGGRCLAISSSQLRQAFGRAPGAARETDLTWLDAQTPIALHPDGSRVLLARAGDWEMSDRVSLYLRALDGGPAINLGTGSLHAGLSPGGQWVATFEADTKGQAGVRLIPTGAGASRWYPLTGAASSADGLWFHPTGGSIYLIEEATFTLSRLDLATGTLTPKVLASVSWNTGQMPFAPDGRKMLFTNYGGSTQDGDSIFNFLLFEGEGTQPRTAKGTLRPEVVAGWADNSQEVYVYDRNAIPATVALWNPVTGARRPFLQITPSDPSGIWGISNLTITPSGRAYAYSVLRKLSDLYLIEGLK